MDCIRHVCAHALARSRVLYAAAPVHSPAARRESPMPVICISMYSVRACSRVHTARTSSDGRGRLQLLELDARYLHAPPLGHFV